MTLVTCGIHKNVTIQPFIALNRKYTLDIMNNVTTLIPNKNYFPQFPPLGKFFFFVSKMTKI